MPLTPMDKNSTGWISLLSKARKPMVNFSTRNSMKVQLKIFPFNTTTKTESKLK